MIDIFLKIIAPNRCYGCGKVGNNLCNSCKYYIINEPYNVCLSCGLLSVGICDRCKRSYSRGWCVGELDGSLKQLIYDYKFKNNRSAHNELAKLMAMNINKLPIDTIVTYVPTESSNTRLRGYDHTRLIAKKYARLNNLQYQNSLNRITKTHQHTSSAAKRWIQAKHAFEPRLVKRGATYLLIDDIVTTGATIEHASRCLKKAGAKDVWVSVLARQSID